MNREYLNAILVEGDESQQIVLNTILQELKINVKVQNFFNGKHLMEYLNSKDALIPEILLMNYNITAKSSIECLQEIRMDYRFNNIVTAIYSDSLPEDKIEDLFVNGTNIYIKRKENYDMIKKAISEVITITWQYHTSGLNKDNLIMKV